MEAIIRVWFKRLDGVDSIRLVRRENVVIGAPMMWPDGVAGRYSGMTQKGILKYQEVEIQLVEEGEEYES